MTKARSKKFLTRKIRRALNKSKDFLSFYKKSYTKFYWGAGISSKNMKDNTK